ncbi:hypothetical protein [Noviherbaspirillum galbum]|uniref:hypothetical protein n=1 Tax=Noviherbaspirillum galbum TaxID=2709383 RepID=UPI001969E585|nr:hypothetical protein [Noviherbaspirillum galbum]
MQVQSSLNRLMEKTTQWRFTPATHIVMAFHEALLQFEAGGGQLARYRHNYDTLMAGMVELGLEPFLDQAIQAPISVTLLAPASRQYNFQEFYRRVREKEFILYPGKLTQAETFRVGCIGAIGEAEMRQAVNAMRDALNDMGILKHESAAAPVTD